MLIKYLTLLTKKKSLLAILCLFGYKCIFYHIFSHLPFFLFFHFSRLQAWVGEIHEYANDDVVVMLLGNKADMTSERVVKREEAEKLGRVMFVCFLLFLNYLYGCLLLNSHGLLIFLNPSSFELKCVCIRHILCLSVFKSLIMPSI